MSAQTVWLLDFDGVLNATRAGWSRPPSAATVWADGQSWRIRWEKHVVAAILAALAAGVEIRWATSWIGDTDALDKALGLPELPIAFELPGSRDSALVSAGKLAAALAVVRDGNRLVWTDDEVIPAVGADRDELTAGGALLVAPKSYRGLRPDDIAAINDYLAGGHGS